MNTNRFPILIAAVAVLSWAVAVTAQNPGQRAAGAGRAGTQGDDLGFTDTPMLPGLPYHVHDPDRPHPAVVTPASPAGRPRMPSCYSTGRTFPNGRSRAARPGAEAEAEAEAAP